MPQTLENAQQISKRKAWHVATAADQVQRANITGTALPVPQLFAVPPLGCVFA
jgi:hypothetical protein